MGKGGKGKNDLVKRTDPDRKCWLGNIPVIGEGAERDLVKEFNKELKEHLSQGGDCKYAEAWKNGTGAAVFSSPEECQKAIATLNGSSFKGTQIQVDVWTQKEWTPGGKDK